MIHRKLKIGVIGLGVGEQHVIGYQRIPNVEVTDICDIDPSVLKIVGDRNDVPNRHQNYKQITENPNIDVVSIASYDNYHAIQAISAFENGKHVMIEKPLALNRHEAEAILRAQQDSGRFLSSNLVLRKSPRFQELKNWIAKGYFWGNCYHRGRLPSSDSLEAHSRLEGGDGVLLCNIWRRNPYD